MISVILQEAAGQEGLQIQGSPEKVKLSVLDYCSLYIQGYK